MSPDIDRVAGLIREAAETYILPRFEKLEASDIREKGPGDLVTIADLETEKALTAQFLDLIPGSTVIGEEAVAKNPKILESVGSTDRMWIIDPVDGTSNFASGISLFVVMVAFVQAGEITASWIYDPVKRHMATASVGAGAWCNGSKLAVAHPVVPQRMSGSVSLLYGNRQLVRKIAGRSNMVGSVFSFRCAGLEYLALSSGRAHFALYHRLMPWDHAPGFLLHREAGGFGKRLDRSAYTPQTFDGGLLLTPDEESWEKLHAVLIGR